MKKNQSQVNLMIQRCHKWRQKRKQLIDQARQVTDEIERERLLQTAEHFCRMSNIEQNKIDSMREVKEKSATPTEDATPENIDTPETSESTDATDATENGEEETELPEFIIGTK